MKIISISCFLFFFFFFVCDECNNFGFCLSKFFSFSSLFSKFYTISSGAPTKIVFSAYTVRLRLVGSTARSNFSVIPALVPSFFINSLGFPTNEDMRPFACIAAALKDCTEAVNDGIELDDLRRSSSLGWGTRIERAPLELFRLPCTR